jgi:hypothetical protein
MLPKLAACPKYRPTPGPAGPAAARGTVMDEAFRLGLQGDRSKIDALPAEDRPAVEWAVALMEDYKRIGTIEAREEYLAMHTPGISHVGTADAVCERMGWVADLKTGQLRGYAEQLAAYCYAMMHQTFEEEYAAHVLYCDQQLVKSYRFTLAQAREIVERILAEVRDPSAEPRACDYCDWCARKDTCPAVVRPVEEGLAVVQAPGASLAAIKERLLGDRELLAAFASQWKAVEKEVAKDALAVLKKILEGGEEVPGWRLSKSEGTEFWDADGILHAAREVSAPLEGLIKAMGGTMSGETYRAWCAEIGHVPVESQARKGKETTRLLQVKKKTKQLKN